MVHGHAMQLVEVSSDGKLIFHREVLDTLVTLCGDFPLAIYTVAGEFRKGKTTMLNIFLAFNDFNEQRQDWKQHKHVQLKGFEARGGSIKVTNGIWVWSKPFFSNDASGRRVAIILMDTQGTFDQDTSSAVNSFIFGFSLAVSSILMYNNMKQISSHDVDSLITFGMTFIPIIGQFQTLSFLVRDWDDEERFPYGWIGGDLMIEDLLNPRSNVDRQVCEARRRIKTMFGKVTGFMFPPPGTKVSRAKREALVIGDMDSQFEHYVDNLCQEIFVRNVKPFKHKGREMNGNDWLTIFDHLIMAYKEGKVMDPGFHQNAFTGSSAKTIKDKIVANYQEEMTAAVFVETSRSGSPYVTESFLNQTESRIRQRTMRLFSEKIAHFGRQDAIEAQMVKEMSNWFEDRKQENARAMADNAKIAESRKKLADEQKKHELQRKELANQMDRLKSDSKEQIERAVKIGKEEADKVRKEANEREAALAKQIQQNIAESNKRLDQLKRDSEEQIAKAMKISKKEADKVRKEANEREAAMAQRMQQNIAESNNRMDQLKRDSEEQVRQAIRAGKEDAERVRMEAYEREDELAERMQENIDRSTAQMEQLRLESKQQIEQVLRYSKEEADRARMEADRVRMEAERRETAMAQRQREKRNRSEARMEQLRLESKQQIEQVLRYSKEEADRARMEADRRATDMAKLHQENDNKWQDTLIKQQEQYQASLNEHQRQINNMQASLNEQHDDGSCCIA